MNHDRYPPGARVVIRDEEWLVRRTDGTSSGAFALYVVGLSPLVFGQEKIFLTSLEDKIEVVDPVNTQFVNDESPYYRSSRLYLESLLRQTPPTDEALYVGNKAAVDPLPYQLDPALLALKEPRQRILIADATGLGKTIECGILLSELIRRGKGKRILVLAVSSMLTQFQKELWARFSIPLIRLDSVGIQRVQNRIPSDHNPLYYYDRVIVSIDTLKISIYQNWLENSSWDIIVIDEAQNVAERSAHSMRSKLARLIATRSDSLIMLSATPHDGRRRSFASLMTMLNPTAIANPEAYGPNDIKGLFIRRFKKDIKSQVARAFPERRVFKEQITASPAEEKAYGILADLHFAKLDSVRNGSMLFRTTLEKSLFSSQAACRETIHNRRSSLEKREADSALCHDTAALALLDHALAEIPVSAMSKYQHLLKLLMPKTGSMKWDPGNAEDRVVVFTERLATLNFLKENLPRDLALAPEQFLTLSGDMPDMDMQKIVDEFGNESSPVRLLICSDVASEGLNLHYFCHRMIHFDIPWSLMVFQQRNGRIDRYGQERRPEIYYFCVASSNRKINGDNRILELLIEKDKEVQESIGDPSEFTGCYSSAEEEGKTAEAMERGDTPQTFEQKLQSAADPMAFLLGELNMPKGEASRQEIGSMPTIFASDYQYAREALRFIQQQAEGALQFEADDHEKSLSVTPTDEMRYRLKFLPPEALPDDGQIHLSANYDLIEREIRQCRKTEGAWPQTQLLWEQHPFLEFLNDKVTASFSRQNAPVMELAGDLAPGECVLVISAMIPNRRSAPLLFRWYGVHYREKRFVDLLPFAEWIPRLNLKRDDRANPQTPVATGEFSALLPDAVERVSAAISAELRQWEEKYRPLLEKHRQELAELRKAHNAQLELDFGDGTRSADEKGRKAREIDEIFNRYREWIEDAMTPEKKPGVRIAAVLKGGEGICRSI